MNAIAISSFVVVIILLILIILFIFSGFATLNTTNSSNQNTNNTTNQTTNNPNNTNTNGTTNTTNNGINTGSTTTNCNTANISDSRFEPCFLLNTKIQDTSRFYDTTTQLTIATIDPQTVPTSTEICAELCKNLNIPLDCLEANFQDCVNSFNPLCPIAKNNLTNYYAIGRGKISCFPSIS